MPPFLLCHSHCDLDLYPIEPQIDKEHLLSMTNFCVKFEKAGPNQLYLLIGQGCIQRTDRQTYR